MTNATELDDEGRAATVFPVGITLLGLPSPMVLTMTKTALVAARASGSGRRRFVLTQPAKTSLATQAADDGAFRSRGSCLRPPSGP